MSRKSMTSSDSSTVSVQATPVDSHKQLDSVKAYKKRVPERFGECNMSNGWIRCASRFSHGRDYFYNTVTGAKSWMYPVSQKIGLSNYEHFVVPELTLRTSSHEDESPLALSCSEQPLSKDLTINEIFKVLNRLYSTPLDANENEYNSDKNNLRNTMCNTVVEACLGTCNASLNDDNVVSLINTICSAANVNEDPQGKAGRTKNDCNVGGRVAVCENELERGGNKKWNENEEIYLKTALPVDQSYDSTSSSSSSTSITSSSNSSSSTSTNSSTSTSTGTTEATAAPPASTSHFVPPLPPESSDSSTEFAVPRLKPISFDDLQKSPVKPKLVPKRKYKKISQPPKPKPSAEPRIPEAIIREVGNIKTISYNHFVPPPPRSPRGLKRSNLSDSSYSTVSDAKKFAKTQTKGIFGNGFGQNFPIILKSLELSEASSSSNESSHE